MKKLGVIGGLGPMATVYFLQLITEMSEAESDQEHMEIFIHMNPRIPDRSNFILGKSGENPFPSMAQAGKGLVRQKAEVLAVPCITAHYFRKELEQETAVPVIDAIEETAICLKNAGVSKAGILATDGTVESGLFHKTFGCYGIETVMPDKEDQKKIMHLIYQGIKAGKPAKMQLFHEVSGKLFQRGAQKIVLGCTELSLLKRDGFVGAGYLDVLEILAKKAVTVCGRLKKSYECLSGE